MVLTIRYKIYKTIIFVTLQKSNIYQNFLKLSVSLLFIRLFFLR